MHDAATTPTVWRRMRIWVVAHAVDDFYQGIVPAMIPFFVLERGYSYTAASGLALAATLGSALPQPLFGILADRRPLTWMAPAGLAVAGVAAGASALVPPYAVVWLLLLLSGLGIAAFHPAAGRDARRDAGESASGMALFAAGGSLGFFLAPALATPALVAAGLGAAAWFAPPSVLMAVVLWRVQRRRAAASSAKGPRSGRDRWGPFAVLTGLQVVRSTLYFGLNTFIALYWIDRLDASPALGGVALTLFLGGGVAGTLLGGRLADRYGAIHTVQLGGAAALPLLVALRLWPDAATGLALAFLIGVAVNVPFAVFVKLGQDYLPSRPGTAAGVTLGLGVSAGGLLVPVLGALADAYGIESVLTALCVVPVVAVGLGLLLPEPDRSNT